jgi:hypothetical protein
MLSLITPLKNILFSKSKYKIKAAQSPLWVIWEFICAYSRQYGGELVLIYMGR